MEDDDDVDVREFDRIRFKIGGSVGLFSSAVIFGRFAVGIAIGSFFTSLVNLGNCGETSAGGSGGRAGMVGNVFLRLGVIISSNSRLNLSKSISNGESDREEEEAIVAGRGK